MEGLAKGKKYKVERSACFRGASKKELKKVRNKVKQVKTILMKFSNAKLIG